LFVGVPRLSLKEQLAEHRKQKAAGNYTRKLTTFGKVGETSYTEDGHVEAPTIYGLKWLRFLGEALVNQGVAWRAQVGTEQWERRGTIRLSLQQIVSEEVQAPVIRAGLSLVTPGTVKVPMGGGVWESWHIPIGAVNAHDTAYVLRAIMSPKQADVVMAENIQIKAMHGR
jgi:hypothetical protein